MFNIDLENKEAVFSVCRELWAFRGNFFAEYPRDDGDDGVYHYKELKSGVVQMLAEKYERIRSEDMTRFTVLRWYGMLVLSVIYGIGAKRFKNRDGNRFFDCMGFYFLPDGPYNEFYDGYSLWDPDEEVAYVFPREELWNTVRFLADAGFFTAREFEGENDESFVVSLFSPFFFCEFGKAEYFHVCWEGFRGFPENSWNRREDIYFFHEKDTASDFFGKDSAGGEHKAKIMGNFEFWGVSRKIFFRSMREAMGLGIFLQAFKEGELEEYFAPRWKEKLLAMGYLRKIDADAYDVAVKELVLLPELEDR